MSFVDLETNEPKQVLVKVVNLIATSLPRLGEDHPIYPGAYVHIYIYKQMHESQYKFIIIP